MQTTARGNIRPYFFACLAMFICLAIPSLARGQDIKSKLPNIKWQDGPAVGALGTLAEVRVPEGFVFAGGEDTRRIMEAMQNPSTGTEMGFVSPLRPTWFVVFEFDEIGYVKDDDKNSLDANALLTSIQKGNEAVNEERKKRGWPSLSIIGWEVPPAYNPDTNNLEWAIKGRSDNGLVVNHNTRILGRKGVMKATLVTDPIRLQQVLPEYRSMLASFTYTGGNKYAEFRRGDKIAQYGLAALIVGGAGAVAVKSGLFKWLWKILVVAALGVAGFLKTLFGRKKEA
jgi:uncharacterized membrane-anchored protein